jgi:transposase
MDMIQKLSWINTHSISGVGIKLGDKIYEGDKIYDCPRCHIKVDRQLAGAPNNLFAAYGMAVYGLVVFSSF